MDFSHFALAAAFIVIAVSACKNIVFPLFLMLNLKSVALPYVARNTSKLASDAMEITLKTLEYKISPRKSKDLIDTYIFEAACKKVIRTHAKALLRKREVSLYRDDYGRVVEEKWNRELEYFINNILIAKLRQMDLAHPDLMLSDSNTFFIAVTEYKKDDGTAFQIYQNYIADVLEEPALENQKAADKAKTSFQGSGHEYEHFIARIIRNAGLETEVTKGSGDNGADVIFRTSDGEKIVVQCKFYGSTVGNKAVQEAYSAKAFYDAEAAWVVTNLGYTQAAKIAAQKLGVLLITHDELPELLAVSTRNHYA